MRCDNSEIRVLQSPLGPQRVRCSGILLNEATSYAITAWIAGLSLELAKSLLEQEWATHQSQKSDGTKL